jgi:HK97 gp10 family phage protein
MIEVRITGIPQLLSRLQAAPGKINSAIAQGFAEAGQAMVSDMQSQCPIDTGELQSSIAVSEASSESLKVEAGADYAIYVEMGTYKMAAQPFFFPVIDQYKSQIPQMIKSHLQI